jgi:nicotinamidase/pyrazinamidase
MDAVDYGPDTALVVVDVQNDFADPDGNLYVSGGEEVVPVLNRQIQRARERDALVVYTQDWHPPETPHFADQGGAWPRHCVQGTNGAELHPDLIVDGPVIRKGSGGEDGYSGFSVRDPETGEEGSTELDRMLREHGTRRVVIAGLAQDVCVRETALDAVGKGYAVDLLTDATRPVDDEQGEQAIQALRERGVTVH